MLSTRGFNAWTLFVVIVSGVLVFVPVYKKYFRDRTVGAVKCSSHVHDLGSQRGHAGAAAYPHHLGTGVEYGMEITVGSNTGFVCTDKDTRIRNGL